MSMNLTFYEKKTLKFYQLTAPLDRPNGFWLTNQDGEGGDFSADEIADVIYKALDKYFTENH